MGWPTKWSEFQSWQGQEFSHVVLTDLGAKASSYAMGTRCSFSGGKAPGREVYHSTSTSAEVNTMWIYSSTPLICLQGVVPSSLSTGKTLPVCPGQILGISWNRYTITYLFAIHDKVSLSVDGTVAIVLCCLCCNGRTSCLHVRSPVSAPVL
jgi:hypothetical protein